MPVGHDADAQSAFPFRAAALDHRAMPTLVQREADLSLRAAHDFVRPRVIWPPDPQDGSPVAVFVWERECVFEAAQSLSVEGGVVVLALQTAALDVATIAVEWVGDHAGLLGADPERLIVAGGGLAAAAALHARDEGWPPLARQLLFGPERSAWPAADASLAGAAPATVVDAPQYASRLRGAGVEVQELALAEPLRFDWLAAPQS
jgi:alpha/beta hydrolase fold